VTGSPVWADGWYLPVSLGGAAPQLAPVWPFVPRAAVAGAAEGALPPPLRLSAEEAAAVVDGHRSALASSPSTAAPGSPLRLAQPASARGPPSPRAEPARSPVSPEALAAARAAAAAALTGAPSPRQPPTPPTPAPTSPPKPPSARAPACDSPRAAAAAAAAAAALLPAAAGAEAPTGRLSRLPPLGISIPGTAALGLGGIEAAPPPGFPLPAPPPPPAAAAGGLSPSPRRKPPGFTAEPPVGAAAAAAAAVAAAAEASVPPRPPSPIQLTPRSNSGRPPPGFESKASETAAPPAPPPAPAQGSLVSQPSMLDMVELSVAVKEVAGV